MYLGIIINVNGSFKVANTGVKTSRYLSIVKSRKLGTIPTNLQIEICVRIIFTLILYGGHVSENYTESDKLHFNILENMLGGYMDELPITRYTWNWVNVL